MTNFVEPLIDKERAAQGGQELILPEIMAALAGVEVIWLPFYGDGVLADAIEEAGILVTSHRNDFDYTIDCEIDAVYFGTPTIVNDTALFPDSVQGTWYKDRERKVVRTICGAAIDAGAKLILSGLGSGDISPEERLADMGGGKIICMKDFGDFKDWVLARGVN
jgi:hypothetical protein